MPWIADPRLILSTDNITPQAPTLKGGRNSRAIFLGMDTNFFVSMKTPLTEPLWTVRPASLTMIQGSQYQWNRALAQLSKNSPFKSFRLRSPCARFPHQTNVNFSPKKTFYPPFFPSLSVKTRYFFVNSTSLNSLGIWLYIPRKISIIGPSIDL